MKVHELRDMTTEELAKQVHDMNKELFNLRLQQAASKLENPARIKTVRRNKARVMTILGEKEG